ncbi:MAG: YceI family protein [Planctomycetia bacterium]
MQMAIPYRMGSLCLSGLLTGLSFFPAAGDSHGSRQVSAAVVPMGGARVFSGSREAGDVNLKDSRVYIYVGKTGLGHNHGVEGRLKSGRVQLGQPENAGELVFDMTSFDADTDASRRYVGLEGSTDKSTRQQVNVNMKGADVLNVQKFPLATFRITSAKLLQEKGRQGLPEYQLDGRFTLHGVTQPLRFQATGEEKDGRIHLRGSFSILQTNYGIRPYSKAFGAVGVTDKLTIYGDLWLEAAVITNGTSE